MLRYFLPVIGGVIAGMITLLLVTKLYSEDDLKTKLQEKYTPQPVSGITRPIAIIQAPDGGDIYIYRILACESGCNALYVVKQNGFAPTITK